MAPRWLRALAGKDDEAAPLGWLDDRHCLLRELGRGATCVVYEARGHSGPSYALKVPVAEADSLLREARFLQAMDSPHVIDFLGACAEGSALYLKTELLRGETLAQRLARGGRLKLGLIERLLEQILQGLEAVHALGVVHGDLKPGNVFLSKKGRKETVKLMDFGLALREGETRPAGAQGTAVYAAPEQWEDGPLDRRADLYAVGVIIFEMATGLLPWSADEPAALLALKREQPVPPLSRYRSDFSETREKLVTDLLCADLDGRPSEVGRVRELWSV